MNPIDCDLLGGGRGKDRIFFFLKHKIYVYSINLCLLVIVHHWGKNYMRVHEDCVYISLCVSVCVCDCMSVCIHVCACARVRVCVINTPPTVLFLLFCPHITTCEIWSGKGEMSETVKKWIFALFTWEHGMVEYALPQGSLQDHHLTGMLYL